MSHDRFGQIRIRIELRPTDAPDPDATCPHRKYTSFTFTEDGCTSEQHHDRCFSDGPMCAGCPRATGRTLEQSKRRAEQLLRVIEPAVVAAVNSLPPDSE